MAIGPQLSHNVKQERLHVVVQRFVVQKHFRKQAKILTIDFVFSTINFEYRNSVISINFISWRELVRAF